MANCFGIRAYSKDFFIIHIQRARELEPILGAWGQSPQQQSRGQNPWLGTRGGKAPWSWRCFVFKAVIFYGSATVLHEMMYYLYFW